MVLELSKNFVHSACKKSDNKRSEEELKGLMLKLMQDSGIDTKKVDQKKEGVMELKGNTNLKLHSLMLKAEELGLEIKYTKKTLIEIC